MIVKEDTTSKDDTASILRISDCGRQYSKFAKLEDITSREDSPSVF